MRKQKNRYSKERVLKNKYCIVADGDTENWYFSKLKDYEDSNFALEPILAKANKLETLYKNVKTFYKEYEHVLWIIDLDVILKENKERRKGCRPPIEILKDKIEKCKKLGNVTIIINNPGLEFWYLLHFKDTSRCFSNCDEVIKELKKCPGFEKYQKNPTFYRGANHIYKKLKPYQEDGIKNSRKLGEFDKENCNAAKCEMFKAIELLLNNQN